MTVSDEDQLERALQVLPEALQEATRQIAIQARTIAEGNSPYRTGHFKGSWSEVMPVSGGMSYSFENPVGYGEMLEYGLYPSLGPRTAVFKGRIYSRQAIHADLGVAGVLTPTLEDVTLPDRIAATLIEEITRRMEGAGA